MGELIAIRPGVSKAQMREATDRAHLHIEYFGDEVRMLSVKIACVGYYVAPKHRAEFLKVLDFIKNDLPLDLESVRCASTCLDVLRERFSA